MAEGAAYRTSAAPAELASTCQLCGADGEVGASCVTCAVAMPCITCSCGAVNGVAATRCSRCSSSLPGDEHRGLACPRCTAPLTEVGVDPTTSVHVCPDCRGLFVTARAWHLLIGRADLVDALAARLPTKSDAPPDVRLLSCPVCALEMERMRFAATSDVVIDVCARQHGTWLDAGELSATTAYAQHRRSIGVEAAIAEADRLQYQLAHEQALAQVEHIAISRRLRGWPSAKEHKSPILALVVLGAIFYGPGCVRSCSAGPHGNYSPTHDNAEKSKEEIERSP